MGVGGIAVGRGIPANREVIRHNETGYLADTPLEMGGILAELLIDGTKNVTDMHATSLSSVGPAAREYVHTHHSMSLEGARYMALLSTLL
jgi:hypothetical protein